MNWLVINQIRSSFISKAMLTFSISVTLLSNTELLLDILGAEWKVRASLHGALFFLVGYLLPYGLATPEFKSPRHKKEIISEWVLVTDMTFFKSRLELFEKMFLRFKSHPPADLPNNALLWPGIKLSEENNTSAPRVSRTTITLKLAAMELYSAELDLRAYDQFSVRLLVVLMLVGGMFLMMLTLIVNSGLVLLGL